MDGLVDLIEYRINIRWTSDGVPLCLHILDVAGYFLNKYREEKSEWESKTGRDAIGEEANFRNFNFLQI